MFPDQASFQTRIIEKEEELLKIIWWMVKEIVEKSEEGGV